MFQEWLLVNLLLVSQASVGQAGDDSPGSWCRDRRTFFSSRRHPTDSPGGWRPGGASRVRSGFLRRCSKPSLRGGTGLDRGRGCRWRAEVSREEEDSDVLAREVELS